MIGREQAVNFRVAVGHAAGYHIDPGGKYFLDTDVVKLNGGLNQIAFILTDGPFIFHFVNHNFQFSFCNRRPGRLFPGYILAKAIFQLFKNIIKGGKQPGIPPQQLMHSQQKRLGILFRQAFGGNFTYYKYNNRCNCRSYGHTALIPDQFNTQKGSNRGRTYIHNIVSYQNCGKDFVKMVQQLQYTGGVFVPISGQMLYADFIHGTERRFRCGIKRGAAKKNDKDHQIPVQFVFNNHKTLSFLICDCF